MVTVRKLATAAAVSLALSSTGTFALTLGEIEMRSALNQPMDAQILLSTSSANEIDGMIVKLASRDDFLRAGIDRTAGLSDLTFNVERNPGGQPNIRISSSKPVLEPFLNFLLEVDWPQGRMVREYTVLLDPPVFMSPDNSQRATLNENALQRADDSLIVPAPIERTAGDVSQGFDLGSVAVMGTGQEISDDLIFDEVGGSGQELLSGQLDESTIVNLESLNGGSSIAGEEVFLGGDTFSADTFSQTLESGTDFGSEVVTLTELNSGSSDVFLGSSSFSSETIDGFEIQVVDDNREMGNNNSASVLDSGSINVSGGSSSGGDISVRKGDTLWEIANVNRVGGLSTQQMMLALLDANQKAFINGNINLLKQGAILRMPGADDASRISQSAAVAEVAQQEQLWREYRDSARGITGSRVASNAPQIQTEDFTSSTDTDTEASGSLSDTESVNSASGEITKQEILEQARQRIEESRNELKLVGENESTDIASSTSADESEQPDTANMGALNRKLQLAREELASTRIRANELSSRDQELQGTAESMDTLVTLRQNEVAKLERQLADARERSQSSLAGIGGGALNELDNATNAASDATADAVDASGEQLPQVELYDEDAEQAAGQQSSQSGENSNNSVTQDSASGSRTRIVQPVTAVQPEQSKAWYEGFFTDTNKLLIGGIGLAALIGLLVTFFRRRSKQTDRYDAFDEEDVSFAGGVDDIDGFENDFQQSTDETSDFTAASAGVAGVGVAGAAAAGQFDEDDFQEEGVEDPFADVSDRPAIPVEADGNDESIGADDTISEADVYLAYGLHGQAEDLLHKAIEKDPTRADYQLKLMQTYHAQGNGEGFDNCAAAYYHNFDAENDAGWQTITTMGKEISPDNPLYSNGEGVVSIGRGDTTAPKLEDEDFSVDASATHVESRVREFGQDDDESHLMDQSIDPGMAFAESDLEATGDFTHIANDLKESSTDTLEFPDSVENLTDDASSFDSDLDLGADLTAGTLGSDFAEQLDDVGDGLGGGLGDSLGDSINDAKATGGGLLGDAQTMLGGAAVGVAGAAGASAAAIGLGGQDAQASNADDFSPELGDTGAQLESDLGNSVDSLEALSGNATSSADDLTMDLDQLSGDLELDSTEFLSGDADLTDDLEIPDLSSSGDLTSDASAAFGNADEMDTMMDLAKAYIDMGDKDSASSALGEIVKSGSPEQKTAAETLLKKIS